ncbi:MAG: M56 family metallopeptidase, partial [Oscillospiraceae bacterium]|nr:M56 family metallopeptidase [Oscillospiraceae bacterium]
PPESAAEPSAAASGIEVFLSDEAPAAEQGSAPLQAEANEPESKKLSRSELLLLIWAAGALMTSGFFICVLLRSYWRFGKAEPLEDEKAKVWITAHPLRRKYSVRQLGGIASPLTYGVLRPVILVPAGREADAYALEHEYMHVRRFDALFKLLLALAAAVHWFNPAVWLMFVLGNRDAELACDEAVLRRAGAEKRGDYARALLAAEEKRGGVRVFCAPFGANTTEERIREIMNYRKKTALCIVLAAALLLGLAACAATGAKTKAPKNAFEYDGLKLTVPEEYAELLVVETGPQIITAGDTSVVLNDTRLFSVTEKASREAGEKQHPGEDWGDGWLFSITRVSEDTLHEMLCADMSGVSVFAKDKDGNYYLRLTPTDVRFNRGDGSDMSAYETDLKKWEELNEWAFNSVIPQFMKDNPQLESYSRTNTMADIYLARAAYAGEPIDLRSLDYGTLDPGADRAYLEQLLDGVALVGVDNSLTPDGEYIVLYMPERDARFDFFRAGGNFVRMTYYNGEELYKLEYPEEGVEAVDIMEQWCKALAG